MITAGEKSKIHGLFFDYEANLSEKEAEEFQGFINKIKHSSKYDTLDLLAVEGMAYILLRVREVKERISSLKKR